MEAPVRDPEVPSPEDVAELHLLISEMDDEITGYRRREAVWFSIVFHALVCVALIFAPKWMPKSAVILPVTPANKDITFLETQRDQQRVARPKTDILSDKNRMAQSRTPKLDQDQLRKLLDSRRPNPPAPRTPPPQPSQQAAQQPSPQQASPQQQAGAQNAPQVPQPPNQTAQLHTPAAGGNPFKTTGPGIQHAIDSLSTNHNSATRYSFGGDYGSTPLHPNTTMRGDVEITSDTMGVDFGPYLQRVLYAIRTHWYNLIPEAARPPIMKNGSLIIEFAILKDGKVSGMQVDRASGDISLDRAAWGGITDSIPFDRLPSEFPGNYLGLRIRFIYNPKQGDLE